jgi:hypothetical protein
MLKIPHRIFEIYKSRDQDRKLRKAFGPETTRGE